jgi:NitT/TauT family transport system ATP-binding protein
MEDKIVIENVYKTFSGEREIAALSDVTFSVKENEFLCVLGPSGCGKTTLLNIIAGLEKLTSGQILVDGKEVKGPGADRGVIFQAYALFPWKTVLQNIEFGPKLRGMPKRERRELALKYIKSMGLSGFEHAYPKELSGGMKQRVAIARVYVNDPAVLLMDEPFANLDAQTRSIMQEELIQIWKQFRKTVFFVTHNIEEAAYLADRIVILTARPGKVKQIVDVNSVLPSNRYGPEGILSAEFTRLKRDVWNSIKEEIKTI